MLSLGLVATGVVVLLIAESSQWGATRPGVTLTLHWALVNNTSLRIVTMTKALVYVNVLPYGMITVLAI